MPLRVLLGAAVLATLAAGCGGASPESEDGSAVDSVASDSRSAAGVLAGAGDVGNLEPPSCIRGGTPREDVRRILGEPDSISFGAWLYGASEIQFGYGVVVEARDPDGRLHLCN